MSRLLYSHPEATLKGNTHRSAGSSTTSTSRPPAPLETANSRNKANHRTVWPYGNYRSYYSFRPAASSSAESPPPADALDGRLALLDRRLFADKRLLDIGTNSGKIVFDALRHMCAASVVGVDIDPLLIEDAWRIASELGYEKGDDHLDFVAANVMDENWLEGFVASGHRQPDVITLFSITKWLHLHHGDAGMTRLFRSLHTVLPVGGVVIIERASALHRDIVIITLCPVLQLTRTRLSRSARVGELQARRQAEQGFARDVQDDHATSALRGRHARSWLRARAADRAGRGRVQ